MFVTSKTHRTLSDKYSDLLQTYARQVQLLEEASQIFGSIPASRLSASVKEQLTQWQQDVMALELVKRKEA